MMQCDLGYLFPYVLAAALDKSVISDDLRNRAFQTCGEMADADATLLPCYPATLLPCYTACGWSYRQGSKGLPVQLSTELDVP